MRRALLIETDYRGHRIEVTAVRVDGAWDAEVRIRRTFTEANPTSSGSRAGTFREGGRGTRRDRREPRWVDR